MNWLAHAHLAAKRSDEPHFALGAMLPDWTAWIGERPRHVAHPALAAGILFHQRCDDAFHGGPGFLRLLRASCRALRAAGLGRGPARGAAHVGLELLLDGSLFEAGADAGCRSGVAAAAAAADHLDWTRPDSRERFLRLTRRIERDAPARHFVDPARVAEGIARTLARRPRLRVPPEQVPVVADWAREARDAVRQNTARLLAETEHRLRPSESPR